MQTQVPGVLPDAVNFMLQVERNRILEGVYPISAMPRLCDVLTSSDGFVKVKLEFGDSVGFASLKGKVSATLMTQCQRCLQPMAIKVCGHFKFALVNSDDDSELLPEEFEPYLLDGEEQSVIDIIEDELLLSIPMVTVHETACSDFMNAQDEAGGVREKMQAEKEASHPFAALQAMKNGLKDKKVN